MALTLSAAEQTGLRVAITGTGLDEEVGLIRWTLYRDDLASERVPVRGFVDRTDAIDFVAYDYEAPLERPTFYVLEVYRTAGRTEVAAGPVQLAATHPIVSNPVTGELVELAAVEVWPELNYKGRVSVIAVVGRRDPVVVSDAATSPSSQPVLRTDDVGTRQLLRDLLSTGQVVLLRAPEPDVEDAYLAVTEWTEQRITTAAADVRRRHQLTAEHSAPPALAVSAIGDTLADLEAAVPTTLAAVSTTFTTLLEIAATDLEAL